ncbi:MAG: diadenylate cyclase CdaA [Lentisphaeria bacterium]|nr:diadenylate cyclase CdaA [Lentisphaeria bacterium]MBR4076539.1 diadenylate cyclase CdaA [Lentisphaeria bacterium]
MIEWLVELGRYWMSLPLTRILAVLADFGLIALLIYGLLYFLRGTRSANVLFGITTFLAIAALLANLLELTVISALLSGLWPILGTAIIVIFQPEIRRFFAEAGGIFASQYYRNRHEVSRDVISNVIAALETMAESKTGALIVFERNIGLEGLLKTSVRLDAKVESILLETIFFKNSPLHDCAVIIRGNRIIAAKAVLPLTPEDSMNPAKKLGTRHRAAIGITEETDAVAVTVSEETGMISAAYKGRLLRGYAGDELASLLADLLYQEAGPGQEKRSYWRAFMDLLQGKKIEKGEEK